jgi:Holliday junction DNA helicase RuvA
MIGQLTGTITTNRRNPLLIDVQGVGYIVHVPEKLLSRVDPSGKQTLLIHSHIREDAFDLYGFLEESELVLFELLLTVSGIGPKTALLVIDRGADATKTAVQQSDVDFFTSIPRLGRKNAQKIIIELKTKLGATKDLDLSDSAEGETKQLMEALMDMGFHKQKVREVMGKLDPTSKTIEQKMRNALKLLGK